MCKYQHNHKKCLSILCNKTFYQNFTKLYYFNICIPVIWFTFTMSSAIILEGKREILATNKRDSKLDLSLSKDDIDVFSGGLDSPRYLGIVSNCH